MWLKYYSYVLLLLHWAAAREQFMVGKFPKEIRKNKIEKKEK